MREFVYRGSDDCRLHAAVLGGGPALILLHGGRPDHQSLLPLAHRLADTYTVVLPDVRGYGRSVCVGPARHTWSQYVDDVGALMDHLGLRRAALGGTGGLGGTITLRAAMAYPQRLRAAVVISVEDTEDDEGEAAMPDDRAFRSVGDLRSVEVPTLIVPDADAWRSTALAAAVARTLPHGHLAEVGLSAAMRTADDLARAVTPAVWGFLTEHLTIHGGGCSRRT